MREFRGKCCSIIFQDPMTSLNPVFTVGNQLREAIELHTCLLYTSMYHEEPEKYMLSVMESEDEDTVAAVRTLAEDAAELRLSLIHIYVTHLRRAVRAMWSSLRQR